LYPEYLHCITEILNLQLGDGCVLTDAAAKNLQQGGVVPCSDRLSSQLSTRELLIKMVLIVFVAFSQHSLDVTCSNWQEDIALLKSFTLWCLWAIDTPLPSER
jgi:hypothetical protein